MAIRFWLRRLIFLSISGFIFWSCDSPNSGEESSNPNALSQLSNQVHFSLQLSASWLQQINPPPSQRLSVSEFTPDQIFSGELLVTNSNDPDDRERIPWSAFINEETFEIQSNNTILLAPGNYRLNILLTQGDRRYSGVLLGYNIVDGPNDVSMTLRPLIGNTTIDVITQQLPPQTLFHLEYDPTELNLAGFADPKIGVIIDGAPEVVFSLNPATGLSSPLASALEEGPHHIALKLYDGDLQRGRSIVVQESVNVVAGQNITMDLVGLHAEVAFSLAEEGDNPLFTFRLPSDVIDEVGDASNLRATLTVVGPQTPLQERTLHLFTPVGSHYESALHLSGVQYGDGNLTLTLEDIALDETIGSCTQSFVFVLENTTIQCDLSLIRRALIGGDLLATLGVNVLDPDDLPLAGVSVYANGELLGVTGSGSFGTRGYFKTFLPMGDYTLTAQYENLSGMHPVALTPLQLANEELILTPQLTLNEFEDHQLIRTHGATDWEHFEIEGEHYLAVANGNDGEDRVIHSEIYRWESSIGEFIIDPPHQRLLTRGAEDWEYFQIEEEHYLIVANHLDDTIPSFNIPSEIFRWNTSDQQFESCGFINTKNALDWEHFQIGDHHYLAVANHSDNGVNPETMSAIYHWNGCSTVGSTTPLEKATTGAFDWEYFHIDGQDYLAVANSINTSGERQLPSYIYQVNQATDGSLSLGDVQSIITHGIHDMEHFQVDGTHYLGLGNSTATPLVHPWTGSSFDHNTISATLGSSIGNFDLAAFSIGNQHFIATADEIDLETGSVDINSHVYLWGNTPIQIADELLTHGARDWEYFQIGHTHFIVVANFINNAGNHNIDSVIYKAKFQ